MINEERLAEFGIAVVTMLVVVLAVVLATQPAQAREIEPDWTWKVYPTDRTNTGALLRIKMDEIEQHVAEIIAEYEAEQAALEAELEALEEEQAAYYEPTYYDYVSSGIYYAEYSDAYNEDGPSHTMPGWYDGYLETYYSDTVARHYMSDQWTVDDEGFYRDQDGRYIIGVDIAEGIELGTVVDTGKGEAIVMDYGSGAHVHDFYVHGW